ncbi:MAG TPA: hypothetical protein DEP51_05785 [Clostridiales bacterium]|nr:hypothetical protein [Clostridiales bacterium]
MNSFCLVFEYDCKKFMNLDRITEFKKNLKKVEEKSNEVKLLFYGSVTNEEFSSFMSYFNYLVGKEICNISISFKTNDLIINKGINNKSVKLSARNAKEIKNKKFKNVIEDYYKKDIEIRVFPNRNWESIILDLIGE